jgi:hypothetical protein
VALKAFVDSLYEFAGPAPPPPLFHYTSLAGLLGILETGELWASELRSLNDVAELTLGFDLITDEVRRRLGEAPDIVAEQLLGWIEERSRFGPMLFAAAFTENGNLLSQWRGYCPPTGGADVPHRIDISRSSVPGLWRVEGQIDAAFPERTSLVIENPAQLELELSDGTRWGCVLQNNSGRLLNSGRRNLKVPA